VDDKSRRSRAAKALADRKRENALKRYKASSYKLATEVLGYGWNPRARRGLTERLHKPIMDWYDANRDFGRIALFMARSRHKTTMIITWIIQDIMLDPTRSHRYWHAANELAADLLKEVASHIGKNDDLRALDPVALDPDGKRYNIFPKKGTSRWVKFGKGDASLSVDSHRKFGAGVRSATLRAQGVKSAVTGAHIDGVGWMDDIIDEGTVLNSELHKVEDFFRHTVVPVVDSKLFRGVGTPWDDQSIYQEWMESEHWKSIIVPGAVSESDDQIREAFANPGNRKVHFTPDYTFTNPVHGLAEDLALARGELKAEQEDMKGKFSPQIMIDSEPESERPWGKDCENWTGLSPSDSEPGVNGPGAVFILSDPAPFLEGGYRGLSEKQRADGTKDYWSICAVKMRVRGQLLDIILLDGVRSQEWSHVEGAQIAAQFMRRFSTTNFISENEKQHLEYMKSACLNEGVTLRKLKNGAALKFASYNKADGKNSRIIELAAWAKEQRFWICRDTCSKEFLYGDRTHTGFLTQMRKYRRLAPNKNNLRFDDDADVVARATDATLAEMAPKPHVIEGIKPMSPYRNNTTGEEFTWGTKHVRA
jgi:hypothetical protein